MTECTGGASLSLPSEMRTTSVSKSLSDVEISIFNQDRDGSGEVIIIFFNLKMLWHVLQFNSILLMLPPIVGRYLLSLPKGSNIKGKSEDKRRVHW